MVLDFPSRKPLCQLSGKDKIPKAWDWVLTRDGKNFIGAEDGSGRRLTFWELAAGAQPRYFPGHREPITAMTISPDGQVLATGADGTDTDIGLWEVPSFRPLGKLPGHQGPITALRFSPDGRTLASAGADRTMRLWDIDAKTPRRVIGRLLEDVWRLCFAPDSRKLFTGSSDGTIQRWSADVRPAATKPGFARRLVGSGSIVVTPDVKRYAILREGKVYVGETEVWTPSSQVLELGTNNTCVLFTSDGQSLLSGTQGGAVQIWSLDRRQPLRRLSGSGEPVSQLLPDEQGGGLVVVHSQAGVESDRPVRSLVGLTLRFEVWTAANWQRDELWTLPAFGYAQSALSADGQWLAVGDMPDTLQVRHLKGPSESRTVSAPLGGTYCLAFSPDGRFLAAGSFQGVVKAWEMPGLRALPDLRAHPQALFALAFSPDSRRLATAGDGADAISLWDTATWQQLITLECPGEQLRQLAFSTDGQQLVARNSQVELVKFWSGGRSLAVFFYEAIPLKNHNITLVLGLTRRDSNLAINTRVLDKDNANAVLFQRTVIDTPQADPVVPSVRGVPGVNDMTGEAWRLISGPGYVEVTLDWVNPERSPTGSIAQIAYDNLEVWFYESSRPKVVEWDRKGDGQTGAPFGLTNAVAVAGGGSVSLALRADGTVVLWGQYSDLFPSAVTVPGNLINTVAVAGGAGHSLALIGDSPPLVQAFLTHPILVAEGFSVSLPTQSGRVYALEYKNALGDASWTALPLAAGTGQERTLTDPTPSGARRFYRVRQW